MGAYLSSPRREKTSWSAESHKVHVAVAAMQGWRVSMEDAHQVDLDLDVDTSFFAVFDGHGGSEVAKFCASNLHKALKANPAFASGDMQKALADSFVQMDLEARIGPTSHEMLEPKAREELARYTESDSEAKAIKNRLQSQIRAALVASGGPLAEAAGRLQALEMGQGTSETTPLGLDGSGNLVEAPGAGCTAVVAVLRGSCLYIANAGDSRCVICRQGGIAEPLSRDHKPSEASERSRIVRAGSFVVDGRVNGSLALSRAIGDYEFKLTPGLPPADQAVTAVPEVKSCQLRDGDEFVVLACDGIWDVMTSQQCCDFVRARLASGEPPEEVACALCDACCAEDTEGDGLGCDNMSVVLVIFKEAALPRASSSARMKRSKSSQNELSNSR